ncbi:MAG: type II secretion system protein [Verrucomicrobiota bacterium JB024]|nr:type II secretion system protein [Verrucomicrobiota bacterium JB024]
MKTSPKGFSLMELLVVIAIIAILSGMVMSGFAIVRKTSDRAVALANLHNIGLAMQNYANDHNGSLPGPLHYGQSPRYRRDSTGQLAHFLWSYLDGEEPIDNRWRELEAMTSPAYLRQRDATDDVIYLVQRNVRMPGERYIPPFGYRTGEDGIPIQPLTLQNLVQYDLRGEWALQDVDQQHPETIGWSPTVYLPKPIHGDVRMTLYFDWSVAAVPVKQGNE